MVLNIFGWFGLISVIVIGLCGFGVYLSLFIFFLSFLLGVLTILFFKYDGKKVFKVDIDSFDDPLQQTCFSIPLPKVLRLFESQTQLQRFDSRITGSEIVDSLLNEIITTIINDYVSSWYRVVTSDEELTAHSIRKLALAAGVNVANRVKSVDWVHLLSTRFPEELTTHLKLFKQSRVRLKHIHLTSAKDISNGNGKPSLKRQDDRKTHRRNKSDTDVSWPPESNNYGKSKFYDSVENVNGNSLMDLFFDLECLMEKKQFCRDLVCTDPEKEYALLCELSEAFIYLVAPEEAWKCHALKLILIELISSVVLRPLVNLLSDPDNINRTILRVCCKEIGLASEVFLTVVRSSDAEELDATLEMVQKDVQKLHSKDSAGEWDLQDRQKLSSLQYLTRIIEARRATLGPQEGTTMTANTDKISEEAKRSLKFLSETSAWRSNAQYSLEIELNETDSDSASTPKAVLDSLRSSALELCDTYLAPNRPPVLGVPDTTYAELVRKITTEGGEFASSPVACFDEVQKCICEGLEDDSSWQADFMMDDQEFSAEKPREKEKIEPKRSLEKCKRMVKSCLHQIPRLFHRSPRVQKLYTNKSSTFPRANRRCLCDKNNTLPKCKTCGDTLPLPGVISRHNRSRSDIVGSAAQHMISEGAGSSNLSTANASNMSLSHSEINSCRMAASIIETALVQEKGKAFGIYAIAVTRLSDNEVWHIYRRYSDFYDLHQSIKERWPELGSLAFPAKKTFQNTSRSVLESRKSMLNNYLQALARLAQTPQYSRLLTQNYLGGFLSPERERPSNTIDAVLVNSLRAGMRTLKNMPDQFANTVDGVMDGISKVFQGKSGESYDPMKSGNSSDGQDEGDESAALRLLEEVLAIRGLWLRRRLLAPLRTLMADRVNKKVLDLVTSLTSPRNVVAYLKTFKQWLTSRSNVTVNNRDQATKARTRVAAKVALLSACSDDLKHLVGLDSARRGLLTVFDLFQTQEINRRIIFVFLEMILTNLFPDNNMQEMFRKMYSNSLRVPVLKKSVNV